MTEYLLQGIQIAAVLQVPGGKGMTQQVSAQPGNTGLVFQPSEQHAQRVIRNRGKIALQKYRSGICKGWTSGKIPQQQTPGLISDRDNALLVAFTVHNGIAFRDMQAINSKGTAAGCGGYTYGLHAFGMDELEVPGTAAEPADVRTFLFDIVYYVLSGPVVLHNGETIGFSAQQRLAITRSPGVALDGMTLKIEYPKD